MTLNRALTKGCIKETEVLLEDPQMSKQLSLLTRKQQEVSVYERRSYGTT